MASPEVAVRKAVITAQRADPRVAAIFGARCHGINPPAVPVWPFTRYGVPTVTASRMAGADRGKSIPITIHVFTKGGGDENDVSAGCAAVEGALHGRTLAVELDGPGHMAEIVYEQTQILKDGDEATAWHGIVRFWARIIA